MLPTCKCRGFCSSPVMQSRFASFKHVWGRDASGLRVFWPSHVSRGLEVRTTATPQRASPIKSQSHLCHRRAPVHRRAHRHHHLCRLCRLLSRTNPTKALSKVRMASLLGGSPSGPKQPLGALVQCATATRKAAVPHGPRKELHLWTVSSSGCSRGLLVRPCLVHPVPFPTTQPRWQSGA